MRQALRHRAAWPTHLSGCLRCSSTEQQKRQRSACTSQQSEALAVLTLQGACAVEGAGDGVEGGVPAMHLGPATSTWQNAIQGSGKMDSSDRVLAHAAVVLGWRWGRRAADAAHVRAQQAQASTHWSLPSSLPSSEQVGLLRTVIVTCWHQRDRQGASLHLHLQAPPAGKPTC